MSKLQSQVFSQKLTPLELLRNKMIDIVSDYRGNLMGRILTIIDASIQDQEQRKALKDVIRGEFYVGDRSRDIGYTLLSFAQKYLPDMYPKTKFTESGFLGMIENDQSYPMSFLEDWEK